MNPPPEPPGARSTPEPRPRARKPVNDRRTKDLDPIPPGSGDPLVAASGDALWDRGWRDRVGDGRGQPAQHGRVPGIRDLGVSDGRPELRAGARSRRAGAEARGAQGARSGLAMTAQQRIVLAAAISNAGLLVLIAGVVLLIAGWR